MNKKGQSFAIILFLLVGIVSVFMIYLLAVPMAQIWDNISEELKGEDAFGSDNRTVAVLNQFDSLVTPAFDQAVFIGMIAIILGVVSLMLSIYPNIDGEDPKERFLTLIWITTAGGCLSAISAALCLVGMWGVRIPRWLIVLPIGMVVVLALIGLPMFVYRTLRLL